MKKGLGLHAVAAGEPHQRVERHVHDAPLDALEILKREPHALSCAFLGEVKSLALEAQVGGELAPCRFLKSRQRWSGRHDRRPSS